ncbi:hypothetical protein [Luteolibacter sp. LG18]|uniref:hypothetical protein n=1 Tax=Luteolibacter sp. LG18 TaxID=2819286 RepID=UPI002B28D962|nr:hypothetical protein llg_22390 [Luteolibacter sp. LG18]
MRTTLDLPDPVFRDLKTKAARDGVTLKELLTQYVEAGLYGGAAHISTRRSPLPLPRKATGKVIPALSNARARKLLDEEDAARAHGPS